MAHIITAEGKIIEGTILTEEDVEIIGKIIDLLKNYQITYQITCSTPAVAPLEFPEVMA